MRTFEEFIEDGLVNKRAPDLSRSRSLKLGAEESYKIMREYLNKIPLSDTNANHVIKNVYDIIMELVRSKMLQAGYNTTGKGAHEAEVSFLATIGFDDTDVAFADKLRYYRNGITYYGENFDAQYATKVIKFLEKVRKKLI